MLKFDEKNRDEHGVPCFGRYNKFDENTHIVNLDIGTKYRKGDTHASQLKAAMAE
jgi:hypothetical protein